MKQITKNYHKGIEYWVKGENPVLLIHTGTHGDEYSVISLVKEYIQTHELPDLVYVPKVSPSAVQLKTRENVHGVDLNRCFKQGTHEHEAGANMEIARMYKFNKCITFHEDYTKNEYYVYDFVSQPGAGYEPAFDEMNDELEQVGYLPLNGVDSDDDQDLGSIIVDGHIVYTLEDVVDGGMFEQWGMKNGVFKRCLCPEIPGNLDVARKRKLVYTMFGYFLGL